MPTPTYGATAAASFTPFAQACDFYDSVGINVHPYGTYAGFTTDAGLQTAIDRIQELGIRHARGLGLYSPANKLDGTFGRFSQFWLRFCVQANASRSLSSGGPDGLGEHPIFNKVGTNEEREYLTTVFESQNAYKIDPASTDGGLSILAPVFGPPQVLARTTTHWEGNVYGLNGTTSGAAIGWSAVDLLCGPNEANAGRQTFWGDLPEHGLRWIGHEFMKLKQNPAYRDIPLLGGEPYVDYNTGRISTVAATLSQIPVAPFSHFTAQQPWTDCGDYTHRQHGDIVGQHAYWDGHSPVWQEMYGPWAGQQYGYWQNTPAVNGMLNPASGGVRFQHRSIPMIQGENGCYQSPSASAVSQAKYMPPDVAGDNWIKTLIQNYLQGFKRTYLYKLSAEGGDQGAAVPDYGICSSDFTRRSSFFALKNLMALVKFTQGVGQSHPIEIPHTFTPGSTQFKETATTGDVIVDMCPKLVLEQPDGYLVLLHRPRQLWHRQTYRTRRNAGDSDAVATAAARDTTDLRNVVLHVPAGFEVTGVAEPAKSAATGSSGFGNGGSPNDGHVYANATDGQAYSPVADGTETQVTAGANNTWTVPVGGLTRVVKIEPVTPTPTTLPIVVPSVGSTPAALRTGNVNGPRLHLKGINVWGLPDNITNNVSISGTAFHQHQYAARATVCDTANDWGANCVRLRAQAVDYNGAPSANTDSLTKTQILDRLEDWRDACVAENMYLVVCPWDGLDGAYAGASFPAQYTNTFQFYTDAFARLGTDPMVMYETPNEPNNITMAQWQGVMQGYLTHFRDTMGYTGVLVLDPPNWANSGGSTSPSGNPAGYSDSAYSALEAFDAARPGMGGKHQLVFAKHDYANNSGYAGTFSQTNWVNGMGGADIKHLIWANEFGNYNAGGPDPDTVAQWSVDYAIAARDRFAAKTNYVGAAPFLFGPWSDANRLTDADNVTATAGPTGWGPTARDYYFGSSSPPPATLWTPGLNDNADLLAADAGQSLGAEIMRVSFNPDATAASCDATFTYYADRGIKILMGAFGGVSPTQAQAENMGNWAQRFGPGGDFWASYGGTDRPITHIEWGNEISYSYRSGTRGSPGYNAIAANYATRFQQAYNAITATGKQVGLLCIADADGSDNVPWVNVLFNTVPTIATLVASRGGGWTCHTYGTTQLQRLSTTASAVANRGAPASIPIDITECGVSTDNGRNLPLGNDYGNGRTLTYQQAATLLQNQVTAMRGSPQGPRIRHFILFQAHDQDPPGGPATSTEEYYGGRTASNGAKGPFTTQHQTILAS